MRKTKLIISVIASLLLIILPFVSVVSVAVLLPPQYEDTFVGFLDEKYERLHSIDEPKIIVVGGSSVAFGLDSEALERYTGMPVVNFGLYAALGTKLMLDLSDSAISKGDIVIIAPELDRQTLSMYFNSSATLKALDGSFPMFFDIGFDNWFNLLGGMWDFSLEKLKRMGEDNEIAGIYRSDSFNEYGDIKVQRPENIMPMWYDPSTPVDLSVDMLGDDFGEFSDYLRSYILKAQSKGATVCFSFSPMNELALTERSGSESRERLVEYLESELNRGLASCEFISDIDDYILDAGYFYDTNYHLNDAGVAVRTARLARDIRFLTGYSQGIIPDEPKPPALPGENVYSSLPDDENAVYFTYSMLTSGAYKGAYTITGLSELGKTAISLTVPLSKDGLKIVSISDGALSGGSLESLSIPSDSFIYRLENGAFRDSNLSELWIYMDNGDDISPPADFVGVSPDFTVHVPPVSNFPEHYYWSDMHLDFEKDAV